MAVSTARRPLPAVIFLLVLLALTVVVWWRVIHRDDSSTNGSQPQVTAVATCASTGARPIKLPAPKTVTVTVFNAANRYQLASQVSAQLKARGFKTGQPDDRPNYTGVAEIEYGKTGKAAATLLAYYLPGSRLVSITRADAGVNLVLGTAYKSLATPATVSRSVAAANKPCS